MTDTIRELISRVIDYVSRTPGAEFKVSFTNFSGNGKEGLCFMYVKYDYGWHYISRGRRDCWSACAALNEDNLKYLLEQLEGEEQW